MDRSPGCSLLPCVVDTCQVAVTVLCSHCRPQAGRRSETLMSVLRQAGRRSETLMSVLRQAGRRSETLVSVLRQAGRRSETFLKHSCQF